MKTLTPMLALLLAGFATNSHAIDNYELSTRVLTIPQVLVGTTTYNNVVLNLRDFDILKIDPNPLTGVVSDHFLLQFVSATLQGEQAKITFDLTSQGGDKSVEVGSDGTLAKARITDDLGNVYDASTVQIRNFTKDNWLSYQFDADIPSRVVITYDKVATNAKGIALLDLKLFASDASFRIGNLPFQRVQ
jgi:hypothetical protein